MTLPDPVRRPKGHARNITKASVETTSARICGTATVKPGNRVLVSPRIAKGPVWKESCDPDLAAGSGLLAGRRDLRPCAWLSGTALVVSTPLTITLCGCARRNFFKPWRQTPSSPPIPFLVWPDPSLPRSREGEPYRWLQSRSGASKRSHPGPTSQFAGKNLIPTLPIC